MPNLGAAIWRTILNIKLLCFPRCVRELLLSHLLQFIELYLFEVNLRGLGCVTRRVAWQLYNRDMYCHKDDIKVICELLAVRHGDLELDLFSNSILEGSIEFLCTN